MPLRPAIQRVRILTNRFCTGTAALAALFAHSCRIECAGLVAVELVFHQAVVGGGVVGFERLDVSR
jgi:hypothetical protein